MSFVLRLHSPKDIASRGKDEPGTGAAYTEGSLCSEAVLIKGNAFQRKSPVQGDFLLGELLARGDPSSNRRKGTVDFPQDDGVVAGTGCRRIAKPGITTVPGTPVHQYSQGPRHPEQGERSEPQ